MKRLKSLLRLIVVTAFVFLLAWGIYLGRDAAKGEQERERPAEAISRVAQENGESIIVLDQKLQTTNGINVVFVKESIPSSAIVWWEEQAWIYVEKEPGRFVRRLLSAAKPGLQFSVVVTGAQQLLSEEFRAQIQVLGEE